MSIKGFPTSGKLFKENEVDYKSTGIDLKKFVTVQPIGSNKYAMDVVTKGYFTHALDAVVEVGSTDATLVITAHGAKVGDVIVLKTTVNAINEAEAVVIGIVDANTIRLGTILSAELTAGDIIDITRPRNWNVSQDGSIVTSQGPLQFIQDGTSVTVNEDTIVPANNRALPVKLTDITGDINITAGDLNVQLTHAGATPDSVQVGDGTTLLGITLANEAKVSDATAATKLDSLITELGLKADLLDTQPVSAASLPLPAGAATEAKQDTGNTSVASIDGKMTTLNAKDFATEATLSGINGKLASIGQKGNTGSMPVTMSTEQQTILETMRNSLDALDDTVNVSQQLDVALADLGGAATEATLASLDGKDYATQTTLSAINVKLPSQGQSTMAGSQPVVIASNQTPLNMIMDSPEVHESVFVLSQAIDTITYLAIGAVIPIGVTLRKIEIKYEDGTPIEVFDGSSGNSLGIIAQGDSTIEVKVVGDAVKQIHIRALGINFTAPNLVVNLVKN